jgi:hypothetical protein
MGKAIVSTSIGAEGIEISNGKNIIIADTCEEFADSILDLSVNKVLFDTISRNARELAIQKYDNSHITNELIRFIESL